MMLFETAISDVRTQKSPYISNKTLCLSVSPLHYFILLRAYQWET